ncbi:hypothetical protein [Verrucomicrobium sp. 3C]|uniref:hypothetical protein n=1 Tax=Verrucomicrobium sp. 3C TaxID=1134055 RepID=UPI000381BC76|nr:hypothetical protein [Verrucomicrobium sp. 3C]
MILPFQGPGLRKHPGVGLFTRCIRSQFWLSLVNLAIGFPQAPPFREGWLTALPFPPDASG